jgi:2-amino-4-hydroxy-6-hydroxymethyldihydropteridine diphosphokinase
VTPAYLGLGSNVGRREDHLAFALERLGDSAGHVAGLSSVYRTDPVGYLDQGPFLNMVARVETDHEPEALLRVIRGIEAARGRARTFRNAPRTIDIDILLYGDRQLRMDGLTIPHPRMHERRFVLIPLLELDPDLHDPGSGRRYSELLDGLAAGPGGNVERVMAGERLLERRTEPHDAG